jgi:hypothetical protein
MLTTVHSRYARICFPNTTGDLLGQSRTKRTGHGYPLASQWDKPLLWKRTARDQSLCFLSDTPHFPGKIRSHRKPPNELATAIPLPVNHIGHFLGNELHWVNPFCFNRINAISLEKFVRPPAFRRSQTMAEMAGAGLQFGAWRLDRVPSLKPPAGQSRNLV